MIHLGYVRVALILINVPPFTRQYSYSTNLDLPCFNLLVCVGAAAVKLISIGVGHMAKDGIDSERGNSLSLLCGLLITVTIRNIVLNETKNMSNDEVGSCNQNTSDKYLTQLNIPPHDFRVRTDHLSELGHILSLAHAKLIILSMQFNEIKTGILLFCRIYVYCLW